MVSTFSAYFLEILDIVPSKSRYQSTCSVENFLPLDLILIRNDLEPLPRMSYNVLVICFQDTEVYLGEIFNHDDSTNDRSPNSKLSGKWLLVY